MVCKELGMVPGENTQLVPTGMACAADEDKVLCIIRDMTDAQKCHKVTLNLPASTTGKEFLKELAKQYQYEENSFTVIYEGITSGPVEEICVNDVADKILADFCVNCGNGKKNNFTINDKDEEKPKPSNAESSESNVSSGLDGLSLGPIGPPTEAYSSNSYTSDYSYSTALMKSDTGFVGLVNQAMTCYLNSLMQSLYMTPEFRNALYRWEFKTSIEESKEQAMSIPYQLQKLFLNLQTSKRRSLETTYVTRSFGWDSSEAWQQHDVQELCRVMFDALETKWKNTDQADLINLLYQGKMKDYVKCLECGNESARIDAYLDIPLVIRPFGSNQAYGSVNEAMDAFVQPEILNGSNQYFCEKCNKKCDAHKGLKFVSFPYLLTLQMKRFDFDYATMHRIKLNDKMTFPEILNLNYLTEKEDLSGENNKESVDRQNEDEPVSADQIELLDKNGSLTNEDAVDEGMDIDTGASASSSLTENEDDINEKNARKMNTEGLYEYELFSIMVHSGSAIGGHYYAYIKDFTDGQWYCFNDQHVSKITYDDIRKTYGGGAGRSGYYSAAYTSSTNAYMLMYRQIDKTRNADFTQVEDFPPHLKKQIGDLKEAEEEERRRREMDRSMCKIKLYCMHPVQKKMIDSKLEVHKDKTLVEATEIAYKQFNLENVVPLSCVRLVKYDDYHDSLERSYEGEEDMPMGTVLGGVKSNYMYDLLLEIKKPEQEFQVYKPGGITVKVYVVDLESEEIQPPVSVRAYATQTVQEFKNLISQVLELPLENMRAVLERYYNDLRVLQVPNKTLKSEGFFRSNKVFVECSDVDSDVQLPQSKLYKILDRHQNTIRIHVQLPPLYELTINRYVNNKRKTEDKNRTQTTFDCKTEEQKNVDFKTNKKVDQENIDVSSGTKCVEFQENVNDGIENSGTSHSDSGVSGKDEAGSDIIYSTQESNSKGDDWSEFVGSSLNSSNNTDKIKPDIELQHLGSGDSASQGNKDRKNEETGENNIQFNEMDGAGVNSENNVTTSGSGDEFPIGKEACEDWDLELETSEACAAGETAMAEEAKKYYHAMPIVTTNIGDRSVTIYVDKRITLGALKKELEPQVGTVSENFKVFRVYTNNQEFESSRLSENLSSYSEDSKLHIKLGRALRKGEYRVKVYQLLVNEKEPSKLLFDTIIAKGMTVRESKEEIIRELKAQCDMDVSIDRLRLRKKTWRNPGTIFVDDQKYEDDIPVYANWEVFVEVLEGEEKLTSVSQVAIFVRRWRPSKYELEPFQEIVVIHATTEEVRLKLSDLSGIPPENVEFGKGRGTFPCDISLLEIHQDLEWNPQVTSLNAWPLYINDDGHVLYYRDKTEELKELSEDERKELQQKENSRLISSGTRITYSPRKERALKIYTDNHPNDSVLGDVD